MGNKTRFLAGALAPVSKLSTHIYSILMDEKELVTHFFKHHKVLNEGFLALNYRILRDRKLIREWTLLVQKPPKTAI